MLWKVTHKAQSKDSAPYFLSGRSGRQLSELASCLPVWTASPPVVYVLLRMLCFVRLDPAAASAPSGYSRPEVTVWIYALNICIHVPSFLKALEYLFFCVTFFCFCFFFHSVHESLFTFSSHCCCLSVKINGYHNWYFYCLHKIQIQLALPTVLKQSSDVVFPSLRCLFLVVCFNGREDCGKQCVPGCYCAQITLADPHILCLDWEEPLLSHTGQQKPSQNLLYQPHLWLPVGMVGGTACSQRKREGLQGFQSPQSGHTFMTKLATQNSLYTAPVLFDGCLVSPKVASRN